MKSHFFAVVSRMKNIYRWGLMRNTKQESLSEHSFEVAVVAHALCVIGNTRLAKNYNADFAAASALFHDTSEIITGDMPTPVKYFNEDIKSTYKQIEALAEDNLIGMLPADLQPAYKSLYNPDEEIKRIIKAADKISALIKCRQELNMGNREFEAAEKSTEKSIKAMRLAEADIFLDEFMESFSLTLDEQRKGE